MGFVAGIAKGFADTEQNILTSKKLSQEDQRIKLQEDQLKFNRKKMMIDAFYNGMGGFRSSTPKGYDRDSLIKANLKLSNMLKEAQEEKDFDENTINFYTRLQKDPHAVADFIGFINDQAKNHDRVFNLDELPTVINILDNPRTSEQEKFDLFKELDILDFKNVDEVTALYTKIKELNTTHTGSNRNLFIQIAPETQINQPRLIKKNEDQVNSIVQMVVGTAQEFRNTYAPLVATEEELSETDRKIKDKVIATEAALENLKSSESAVRAKAQSDLMSLHLTPSFIRTRVMGQAEFLGIESNPTFDSLLRNSTVVSIYINQDRIDEDPSLEAYKNQFVNFYMAADGKYHRMDQEL